MSRLLITLLLAVVLLFCFKRNAELEFVNGSALLSISARLSRIMIMQMYNQQLEIGNSSALLCCLFLPGSLDKLISFRK